MRKRGKNVFKPSRYGLICLNEFLFVHFCFFSAVHIFARASTRLSLFLSLSFVFIGRFAHKHKSLFEDEEEAVASPIKVYVLTLGPLGGSQMHKISRRVCVRLGFFFLYVCVAEPRFHRVDSLDFDAPPTLPIYSQAFLLLVAFFHRCPGFLSNLREKGDFNFFPFIYLG